MTLKLMYITNDPDIARIAENSGVDWIFIDLEILGKEERQGHLDTVISHHDIEDIKKIKGILTKAELLVRVNPIHEGSQEEISRVINDGADIVMLPYFKTGDEVSLFVDYVNDQAETCLLLETPEAVQNLDSILNIDGINHIHIGLNDLHLGYNMKFMFQLLADGTVEKICNKIKSKRIPYGFGGIAQLGQGVLPAENILAEHYRLGSDMVILSRSFCNPKESSDLLEIKNIFQKGVEEIRNYEYKLTTKPESFYQQNHIRVKEKVEEIVCLAP